MVNNWAGPFLETLCVLEIGARTSVGACGQLLAMLGAKVIVPAPPIADSVHKWRHRDVLTFGKEVIDIDHATSDGRTQLGRLVANADVVILSSDIAPLDKRIWDADRPQHQIICDITAFGHDGPLAGYAYSEALIQALAGIAATTGQSDGPPALTSAPFLDMQTAVYSASAILAALHVRQSRGFGQRIDMAAYDVAVNALLTFIPLQLSERPATRMGNRHPTLVPWNSYRASDGWILICAPTNEQWRRLCSAMSTPELCTDSRFESPAVRLQNVGEINDLIGAWTITNTVASCLDCLASHGVPSGTITDIRSLPTEPNLLHRHMIHRASNWKDANPVIVPGSPIHVFGKARSSATNHRVGGGHKKSMCAPQAALHEHRLGGCDTLAHRLPLMGFRVVEIGTNTVGPLAARQWGALGAEVIKVEPPSGDPSRSNAPFRADGQSYAFALSNTDKQGVVLDLHNKYDKARLYQILGGADVFIENLKPGSLEKLGFGSEEMQTRFPSLIHCSISGFGHDSAYPMRPALDAVIQGMSGIMSATTINGYPTKTGVSTSDLLGGQFGLLATLAASVFRHRSGVGIHLDLAMQDCSAWATQTLWNASCGDVSSTVVLETADGWIAVEGTEASLKAALGLPTHSAADTSHLKALSRQQNVARINRLTGCTAVPVLNIDEVLRHPQTVSRGLLKTVPAVDGSQWTVLESPLRLLSTPANVRKAMPPLGAIDQQLADEMALAKV